jgi:flagellar basal body-associated protein FliL
MKNEETNLQTSTKTAITYDTLLAVVLIILIWVAIIAIATLFAWMGGNFFIRTCALLPFSYAAVKATKSVWWHYR